MKYAALQESSRSKYPLLDTWFKQNQVPAQYHELPGGGRLYRVTLEQVPKLMVDPKKPGPLYVPVDVQGDGTKVSFNTYADLHLTLLDKTPRDQWVWQDA